MEGRRPFLLTNEIEWVCVRAYGGRAGRRMRTGECCVAHGGAQTAQRTSRRHWMAERSRSLPSCAADPDNLSGEQGLGRGPD